ncbi:MAG: YihY/virulence factor BrkB family protein [Ruminococcus sp.]|nr:YihY/virulence factor BrkB family protein [Ruminococcus sp.]
MIQLIMRIYRWLKPFLNKLTHDNIYAIAGQSAFFLLLSAVPLAIFGVSILQNLHIPVETLNSFFSIVFNEEVSQSFAQFMSNVYESATGVSLVAIIVTLWSAAKGIQAITNGLNRVHETYENRNWLVLRIRSMLYTVVFILILLATMLIVVLGSTINGLLREYHIKIPGIFGVFYHLRFGIIFVYLVVLFAMIYRNVPNLTRAERKKYGFLYQLPGAFFCAVSWLALSLGISIYVDDFNGFSIYGSLTKLAVVKTIPILGIRMVS